MSRFQDPKDNIDKDLFGLEDYVNYFINEYFNKDYSGTIFLNGKWGSGKTTFLNFVKEKTNNKNIRLININVWHNNITKSPYENIYQELCPKKYKFYNMWFLLVPLITSAMLILIQYLNKSEVINKFTLNSIVIFTLALVSIYSLNHLIIKTDKELFYYNKLKKFIKSDKTTKVFIFDDFDRISNSNRNNIYPIFDVLNNTNIVLIIVGDYSILDDDNKFFFTKDN